MLTKQDKNYINTKLEENRIQFRNEVEPFFQNLTTNFKTEFERHTGALQEDFSDKFKLLYEMLQDRPTRAEVATKEEVREMIKAETDPIRDALTHHILFD